jgi:hypothetical protein
MARHRAYCSISWWRFNELRVAPLSARREGVAPPCAPYIGREWRGHLLRTRLKFGRTLDCVRFGSHQSAGLSPYRYHGIEEGL